MGHKIVLHIYSKIFRINFISNICFKLPGIKMGMMRNGWGWCVHRKSVIMY